MFIAVRPDTGHVHRITALDAGDVQPVASRPMPRDSEDTTKQDSKKKDIIYTRLPPLLLKRLDKRVEKEKKKRKNDVDENAISRSSIVRAAVSRYLDELESTEQ